MPGPKGFVELVKLASKERPVKPKSREEIWNRFLFIVFMGGKRSEPEINFLINMLSSKNLLDLDYVKKTDGEDWREAVEKTISERLSRIKDEDALEMLREFQKELFRVSASIKGGARFFFKNNVDPEFLEESLKSKESTREFIENLVADEDVSNIKYTKVIIWLHSMGFAEDFCPPSYQTKSFINEVYGYYQFYEDDKYFMKKAEEFAEEIRKEAKLSVRDVAMAIFYYVTLKSMLPPRSQEKKKFIPAVLVSFLKSKKLTLKQISERLADFDKREELMESLFNYLQK
ncbi:MAG: hypothetical protein HY517_03820 [Candidatus Aenigmarchaeota archaeon]|nr:hypothetical protein [Candidatus Aenigmarchaeota archaeon]